MKSLPLIIGILTISASFLRILFGEMYRENPENKIAIYLFGICAFAYEVLGICCGIFLILSYIF